MHIYWFYWSDRFWFLVALPYCLFLRGSTSYTTTTYGFTVWATPLILRSHFPILYRTTANCYILDSPASATPAPPHPSSTHTMATHDQLANRQAEWADTVTEGIPALNVIVEMWAGMLQVDFGARRQTPSTFVHDRQDLWHVLIWG